MYWSCFIIILTVLIWSSTNSFTPMAFSNNGAPDRLALLAFKEKINGDPLRVLSSWNDSVHYCDWNGVTCGHRHHDRVTVLDLDSQKLEGTLSPHIGNLSFLQEILLCENEFHGPIPQEIGRLSRLKVLSLTSNSFSGEIPTNLTYCSKLQVVNLTQNYLIGGIPIQLTSLLELILLHLGSNQLEGHIPSMLGNLTALTQFDISDNNLIGSIPEDLCQIQSLEHFRVGVNKLTGTVPSCLYNLSHITYFSIAVNQLEGSLPSDIGLTLPNLKSILVGTNKLKGLIPLSFPNASRLEKLSLSENQMTGHVPRNLGMLHGLSHLLLFSNRFGDELQSLILSLTNCTNLEWLELDHNYLKGPIPNSIGNLSTRLTKLRLGSNQLYGSIPASIRNLVNLNFLEISYNRLVGDISKVIGIFPQMVELYLCGNEFHGEIPDSFNHNSTQLTLLALWENNLHGKIPPTLGNCHSLLELYLLDNRLSGNIPKQLFHLPSLNLLDLSNNALSGPLPSDVGNLTNLMLLVISGNKISGSIPSTLGDCLALVNLSISQNLFIGSIPQSLSALKGIKQLNLSHNKISGQIPPYLGTFTSLIQLDLSYNDLNGFVPKVGIFVNASAVSVVGNSKLCGGVVELKLPPCQIHKERKSQLLKVVLPVIGISVCLVLLLCLIFVCYRKRVSKAKPTSQSLFINQFPRITYADLLEATNRFSSDNLIGIGSFGSVYKAILSQVDTTVAVKVINLQQRGAFKSFLSECNALKNLRHRNLLKIITTCSSIDFQGNDFKALVFEFMPNGSLEKWLHHERSQQLGLKLNFLQRLNIAIDVASALDYLHNYCQPTIVHCDLKPSNVLLDDDMTGHVADFGLAKIFSTDSYKSSQSQGSSIAIKGSIGYIAPEYGMGGEVSMPGDVYSYGIMLLEMFIGKKPTDDMFQNGQNLHRFAKMALPEQVMNIVDANILSESTYEAINTANQSNQGSQVHNCLVSVIRLGVTCSAESPVERMKIEEVITELHHISDHYQGVRIHLE